MKTPDHNHTLSLFDIIYQDADQDAIIATASRRPTKNDPDGNAPHYLEPIPIRDRREIIPQLFELAIEQTMYFMPNTLNQDALHQFKRYHNGVNPPHNPNERKQLEDYQQRRNKGLKTGTFKPLYFNTANHHVKQLVAITVDLDVGRDDDDMTSDMAVGYALSLARYGEIPLPSLTAASGRGAYLLWLLKDADTGQLPETTKDNIARWKKITAELCKKLEKVKADRNATRLANWFKMPGTIDTKTGNLVYYSAHMVSAPAEIPRYDLTGLVKDLDIFDEPMKPKGIEQPKQPAITFKPKKINVRNVKPGQGSGRFKKPIDEIELIAQHRQGISEGLREITLFYYYHLCVVYYKICLKDRTEAAKEAKQRTINFNKHFFTPPLPQNELQSIFRQDINMKVANKTLAYDLQVTIEEANKLGLQCILPPELAAKKEALKQRDLAQRKMQAVYEDIIRKAIIAELMDPHTNESPVRIANKVTASLDLDKAVSRQLVSKYKQKLKKEGKLPNRQQEKLFSQ